jgi:sulfite dehydrogenase (quinone) subunit SoeA
MCACRCGIDVHLKDGKVAYIEGNRDHPVNRGVLCAKGSAGHHAAHLARPPARAAAPHGPARVGRVRGDHLGRGAETRRRLAEAAARKAPEKLAFFTGRDQSQSFTGWWAQAFGTPNYAAHGGFCSVNMAAAGIYTIGGAFWEFGQPDWDRTKLFMLFGVAEDHDSNPIKMGIGKLKARGAKVIGVNPIRTGYNAVADDWYGITPGTDGLLILSLIHCLMKAGRIDLDYLARWTNAPAWSTKTRPRPTAFSCATRRAPLVIDRRTGKPAPFDARGRAPTSPATWRHAGITHRPVLHLMADRYLPTTTRPRPWPTAAASPPAPHPRARRRDRPHRLRARRSRSTSPGPTSGANGTKR